MNKPEKRLAEYWREKTGLGWSDFDIFQGKECPKGTNCRNPYWITTAENLKTGNIALIIREIALIIANGFPLSFVEYHIAIAERMLLGDGISYEDFYKNHWFENEKRRGYSSEN